MFHLGGATTGGSPLRIRICLPLTVIVTTDGLRESFSSEVFREEMGSIDRHESAQESAQAELKMPYLDCLNQRLGHVRQRLWSRLTLPQPIGEHRSDRCNATQYMGNKAL